MDDLFSLNSLNSLSAVGVLATIAVLVITEKLIWHKRLAASEARADRWETIALDALRSGAQAGVSAAETTAEIVSAMPTPTGKD